ncbi:MAG TPA: prolyl oligopeptidase family serine peptidase, partial [Chthoniobacteraceae bacterium]|nr:prolyl oligopeptidase family serine peptidase [Chthoniobacteraceae bacterium]
CLFLAVLAGVHAFAANEPMRREWTIDGVVREALIAAPASAKSNATPLVFVFHGHGGSMQNAARSFHIHALWPEAIVIYPQGLVTPGALTDPEGKKAGWQHGPGDQGDRDLHFFDAMFDSLHKDFRVDDRRIYATGHSNGGGFTYLLWATRGDRFAAFAPSSAAALKSIAQLKPKPVLHIGGEADPLVKFEWQKATMDKLREINQCGEGQPWGQSATIYPSKIGAPVVTLIHPGGHLFLPEAPAAIVKFFKEQPPR